MPEIGQAISHYRIVEKIGQGGMGTVFLAEDLTLDRKVALKFLPEAVTSDTGKMARFERVARLLASFPIIKIASQEGQEGTLFDNNDLPLWPSDTSCLTNLISIPVTSPDHREGVS